MVMFHGFGEMWAELFGDPALGPTEPPGVDRTGYMGTATDSETAGEDASKFDLSETADPFRPAVASPRTQAGRHRSTRQERRRLRAQVVRLRRQVSEVEHNLFLLEMDEDERKRELAKQETQLASLRQELGLLRELRSQDMVAEFRAVLVELRKTLRDAPGSGRGIEHLDDLSGYWHAYENWYYGQRVRALRIQAFALSSEVDFSQLHGRYTIRAKDAPSYNRPPAEIDRVPFGRDGLVARGSGDDVRCPGCGVSQGSLHLITSTRRPLCDQEMCPYCHGFAVRCRHCVEAVANHAINLVREQAIEDEYDSLGPSDLDQDFDEEW